MKKLLTLALAFILAMGTLGLVACGGSGESMTQEEFIAELSRREAATFADENLHYATVDCTYVEHSSREINVDGTYGITYGDNYAYAAIEYGTAHGTQETVLGMLEQIKSMFERMPEEVLSELKFVKDGDNLEYSLDTTWQEMKITGKYVFDKNGYVIYGAESATGDGSKEFTVKAYNKKSGGDTADYTVNSEQWDNAVSLYWKNLTYEYTDGESGNKVELLEDGGLHQYAGEGHGWGEGYVIYADNKWKVYQGDATTPTFEYETAAEYIAGGYGDDFGFMGHMLPTIRGRMDEFTFDQTNNQYVAENIDIAMGPDAVYPMNITVKFENQKLVYVKFAAVGGSNYMEANFWNYGTTVIEYPDYIANA